MGQFSDLRQVGQKSDVGWAGSWQQGWEWAWGLTLAPGFFGRSSFMTSLITIAQPNSHDPNLDWVSLFHDL